MAEGPCVVSRAVRVPSLLRDLSDEREDLLWRDRASSSSSSSADWTSSSESSASSMSSRVGSGPPAAPRGGGVRPACCRRRCWRQSCFCLRPWGVSGNTGDTDSMALAGFALQRSVDHNLGNLPACGWEKVKALGRKARGERCREVAPGPRWGKA